MYFFFLFPVSVLVTHYVLAFLPKHHNQPTAVVVQCNHSLDHSCFNTHKHLLSEYILIENADNKS